MSFFFFIPGESVLPAEHLKGSHHQAEGDTPGRVEPLHEGCESHPHPHPSARHPVRPAPLQAPGTLGL